MKKLVDPLCATPKPCHVCGAPIEYESYATVSKCRHYIRTKPPLPTDGAQTDTNRGCVVERRTPSKPTERR